MSWRRQLICSSSSKLLGKSGDHSETKLNYANTLMPDNSSAGSFYRVVRKPVKIINVLSLHVKNNTTPILTPAVTQTNNSASTASTGSSTASASA